jgi:competence protein ComEA
MIAFVACIALVLGTRGAWEPRVSPGVVIEVVGAVPRPGLHALAVPTVAAAVAAAGGDAAGLPDTPLVAGDRVVVGPDGVHVAPSGDPLLVGLPVDVNTADAHALSAIPGIGPSVAEAIVSDRAAHGRFYEVADLERVPGVGASTRLLLEPFVTVGEVGPRPATRAPTPVDVNTATAAELETLPGIGPVTASRIVVDRDQNGPYATLDDLERVAGIGPKTVARLREDAVAGP